MKHEEMQWKANDGLHLYAQTWEPAGETRAVLCLVHGLGEHSGRYNHWKKRLADCGYATMAIDLRGHGLSGGQRGDITSFDHLADDVSLLVETARNVFKDRPCFIYGHSMGGLVALFYLLQRRPALSGAVITSPFLHSVLDNRKTVINLGRIVGTVLPRLSIATGLEQDALSRDRSVIAAYRHDPLVHDRGSLRSVNSSLNAIRFVYERAPELSLPLLIMHGTADRITFATGSEELARLVPGDCTLKLWENCYHELHNEPEKDEVFTFLKEWLDARSS